MGQYLYPQLFDFKDSSGNVVIPAANGTYLVASMPYEYEAAYPLIKFYASEADATGDTGVSVEPTSGTIEFKGCSDPPGYGAKRYLTIENGQFQATEVDTDSRTRPYATGPMSGAQLTISSLVAGTATHFRAWIVRYP